MVMMCVLQTSSEDYHDDGVSDVITVKGMVPLSVGEKITSITAMLGVNVVYKVRIMYVCSCIRV